MGGREINIVGRLVFRWHFHIIKWLIPGVRSADTPKGVVQAHLSCVTLMTETSAVILSYLISGLIPYYSILFTCSHACSLSPYRRAKCWVLRDSLRQKWLFDRIWTFSSNFIVIWLTVLFLSEYNIMPPKILFFYILRVYQLLDGSKPVQELWICLLDIGRGRVCQPPITRNTSGLNVNVKCLQLRTISPSGKGPLLAVATW